MRHYNHRADVNCVCVYKTIIDDTITRQEASFLIQMASEIEFSN